MLNYICIHLDIDKCKFQLSILCTCIYIYEYVYTVYMYIFSAWAWTHVSKPVPTLLFFWSAPVAFRRVTAWGLLADQRGIEPPPAVCQRYKSAAIPTEPRGHLKNLCLHCTQCRHRSKEQSPNTLTRYPMQGSRTIAVSKLLGSTSRAMIASTSKLGRYPMHARMPSNSNCHVHWLGISCRDSKVE